MTGNEKFNRLVKRRFFYQILLIFIFTLAFMAIYQFAKIYFFEDITLFQSNITTVIFSAVIASVAAYFIIKNQQKLIEERNTEIAKRKEAFQNSVLNNSLLEATIDSTKDGILVVDTNGKVTITNKKFSEMWRIPQKLIDSRDDKKLLDAILDQLKDPDKFLEKVNYLYSNSEKESYDLIEFKDGRIFERISVPQRLDENIIGRVWSFRDITDSKRAEQILRESEKTYKAIFENSTDGMFLLDDVFLDCNDSVSKLFGCTKEEIIGKTPVQFSPEKQPDGVPSDISAKEKIDKVKAGNSQRFYWKHKRKDGSLFDAEVSLTQIKIRGKAVIFAVVRDISSRKRDENIREALYQISEAAFTTIDMKSLYKTIHNEVSKLMPAENFYIAIYDDKTNMISFPYFVDEYDPPYPPQKFGKGLTEYVLRKGEAVLIDEKKDYELREAGEVDLVGTPTLIWLGVPLKIEGKTIGVIVVQDYHKPETYGEEEKQVLVFVAEQIAQVIERKRNAEAIRKFSEELKELNTTKDKFFSIIAHDLKNPFITILGFSDILMADYDELSEDERKFYIAEMEKSAKLSHSLLQNLLQWSRTQTGRIEYNPQKVKVSDAVNENFQLLKNSAVEKEITLKHDLSNDLVVKADSDMLNTIIRNLITNAIKFCDKKGSINVKGEPKEEFVQIQVEDTGVGMEKDTVDKLFRLDTTKSKTGTRGETGTGLGLILCKEFVEKHSGKIWVTSEVGKGSTFYFTLPKAK